MGNLYKKLSKQELKQVQKSLPDIDNLLFHGEDNNLYKSLGISTFDHWLSESEAAILFDITKEEQVKRNLEHFQLRKLLYKETTVYDIRLKGRRKKEKYYFRKYNDYNSFKKKVADDSFCILALPEYEAIYHHNFDDTHILYFRDSKKIEKFKKLVKLTKLHILE